MEYLSIYVGDMIASAPMAARMTSWNKLFSFPHSFCFWADNLHLNAYKDVLLHLYVWCKY